MNTGCESQSQGPTSTRGWEEAEQTEVDFEDTILSISDVFF